jgi:threonylcarbamoyladenosine tRNA methylthiotransferase MtaB
VKKVFVQSFGCRASQADGAGIESSLEERGFQAVPHSGDADLVILNTCTVTSSADSDARQMVRRVHRENPAARILVTGCFAQRAPEEISALEGVTWVVGNSHKTKIADIISDGPHHEDYHGQVFVSDIAKTQEFLAAPVVDAYGDRTRPNLKVQDGCSNKCAFCIIPSVRGRSRSAPVGSVIEQIRTLAAQYREVVLSGINLGRWGRDLPGQLRFTDLLRIILSETPVERLRISSVEPMDWSADLLSLIAGEPRIAKHVHIPLQSGSDAVLKRMYRKYRTRHYATRLELAAKLMPDAAIGADVMAGFPGETGEEFQETVRFIEDQPFTYLHVFTYSERPGTIAAASTDQVPVDIRRERTRILRDLSNRKQRAFQTRMVGRVLSAVTLNNHTALSSNYLRIDLVTPREPNHIVDIEIGSVAGANLKERQLLPVLSAQFA